MKTHTMLACATQLPGQHRVTNNTARIESRMLKAFDDRAANFSGRARLTSRAVMPSVTVRFDPECQSGSDLLPLIGATELPGQHRATDNTARIEWRMLKAFKIATRFPACVRLTAQA
jgi:hypothetical protein